MPTLTEAERNVLAIERQWWKFPGAKESAIRDRLDMTATRYYQVLNKLADREDALAHDPVTVNRVRRVREMRLRGSGDGMVGSDGLSRLRPTHLVGGGEVSCLAAVAAPLP